MFGAMSVLEWYLLYTNAISVGQLTTIDCGRYRPGLLDDGYNFECFVTAFGEDSNPVAAIKPNCIDNGTARTGERSRGLIEESIEKRVVSSAFRRSETTCGRKDRVNAELQTEFQTNNARTPLFELRVVSLFQGARREKEFDHFFMSSLSRSGNRMLAFNRM